MKVAILRKTNNLENDDRIRKEVGSLSKLFPWVTFKCFLMLDNNQTAEGVTSYGLPYKAYRLSSRIAESSGSNLIKKSWDFYKTIKKELNDYDVVWCSGDEPVGAFSFVFGKTLVWDLRELPLYMMSSFTKRLYLRILFKRCNVLLHANQYRINYLKKEGLIKDMKKHVAIRNFPAYDIFDSEYDNRYYEVKDWIGGRKCVYLQGLDNDSRAAVECISAVLNTNDLCTIVLGRFYSPALDILNKRYGKKAVEDRVLLAGNFKVLKVPQYMKLCQISMVFYKDTSPNNYLCEANRLYQAIDSGLPVVVGSNPSMKAVVEDLGVGVCVNTDGKDVDAVTQGLKILLENYDIYKTNINKLKNEIKWASQEPLLKKTFESIIYNK